MTWIQTYTGKKVHPLSLEAKSVCIEDIAHALAVKCRFMGHTKSFYSVAQHSFLCSVYIEDVVEPCFKADFALEALLHDAHEAYLVDFPSPIKRCFAAARTDEPGITTLEALESRVQNRIDEALQCGTGKAPIIKHVDNRMLATEERDLMPESFSGYNPYPEEIVPVSWEDAERMFLDRYYALKGILCLDENDKRESAASLSCPKS